MEDIKLISEAFIPYLRSCEKETPEPLKGNTTGTIPSWLRGTLLRNGPGLKEFGPDKFKHVFDGMALIHKFTFHNGEVLYQNRFLRSDAFKVNMEANRIIVSEFATKRSPDLCKTVFEKYASRFSPDDFTDNALVNIIQYGDEFYAQTETNYIWRVDPDTLESIKKVDLRKYVDLSTATAHTHEDTNGVVYNIGMNLYPKTKYLIIAFPPKDTKDADPFEKGHIVSSIPPAASYGDQSYFHSFGMSENYFVFIEQPLQVSYSNLEFNNSNPIDAGDTMVWHEDKQDFFRIIRRDNGKEVSTKYVSDEAFFVFHHINTYEEDGHLVVDICRHNGNVIADLYYEILREFFNPDKEKRERAVATTARYVIPLDVQAKKKAVGENLVTLKNSKATAVLREDGAVVLKHEDLTADGAWHTELPRINYDYNAKKYRYCYAVARKPDPLYNGLVKVDCETKIGLGWNEEGAMPSEPVFVPNPDSKSEDDGVILASLLYVEDQKKVSLLVLDARNMTEIGRTDFLTEASVTGTFHGIYASRP